MTVILWWIRQAGLILTACFFILFGINLLISAYRLKDPFSFIMTFFASNLIILISATLLIGFVIRVLPLKKNSTDELSILKNNEGREHHACSEEKAAPWEKVYDVEKGEKDDP